MKRNDDSEFALLCIAAILGGITGWAYYLVFLLFPFSLAFSTHKLDTLGKRMLLITVLAVVVTAGAELSVSRPGHIYPWQFPLFYLPMFATIVLGGFLLVGSRVNRPGDNLTE
jgi:uncharacterized RDD family membrane protein YckC